MEKRNITKKGVRYKQEFYWADFMRKEQGKQVLVEVADRITIAVYLSGELIGFATRVGEEERKCKVCGCTWNNACLGGCFWVKKDLCSSCVNKED